MVTKPNIGEEGWGPVLNAALDELENDRIAGDDALTGRLNALDDGPAWFDADGLGFLAAGWTGTARLRKIASIVYFQFYLVAAASIDGQTKDTSLAVLHFGADPTFAGTNFSGLNANDVCFTDGNELMRVQVSNSVLVEGTAGVTGTWVDGVSELWGQVSWITD